MKTITFRIDPLNYISLPTTSNTPAGALIEHAEWIKWFGGRRLDRYKPLSNSPLLDGQVIDLERN